MMLYRYLIEETGVQTETITEEPMTCKELVDNFGDDAKVILCEQKYEKVNQL